MTTGPGATSPDSAGKPIAPRAMEPSIQQLLLDRARGSTALILCPNGDGSGLGDRFRCADRAERISLNGGFRARRHGLLFRDRIHFAASFWVPSFSAMAGRVADRIGYERLRLCAARGIARGRPAAQPVRGGSAIPPRIRPNHAFRAEIYPRRCRDCTLRRHADRAECTPCRMGRMACRMVGRARPARIAYSLCERRQSHAASARRDNSPVDGGHCSAITQAADSR
jgi:hypothetical protein